MIHVSTSQYRLSHGKSPRGQGSWAFFFDGETDTDKAFWHNGSYSDALKMAKAWAMTKKHASIEVGS